MQQKFCQTDFFGNIITNQIYFPFHPFHFHYRCCQFILYRKLFCSSPLFEHMFLIQACRKLRRCHVMFFHFGGSFLVGKHYTASTLTSNAVHSFYISCGCCVLVAPSPLYLLESGCMFFGRCHFLEPQETTPCQKRRWRGGGRTLHKKEGQQKAEPKAFFFIRSSRMYFWQGVSKRKCKKWDC